MSTSPTQRSLARLRSEGYQAQVVERYCPHSRRRIDLFGIIDLVAIRDGEPVLAVQTTSADNLASRVTKALAEPRVRVWLSTGARLVLHGWSKRGKAGRRKLWDVTVRELTLADLPESGPPVDQAVSGPDETT